MKRRDVGIADQNFRVVLEDLGIEMWQKTNRAVTARTCNDRVHLRVHPHLHEALGASLILTAREARWAVDFRIEQNPESRALQSADAALQPAGFRRVGG